MTTRLWEYTTDITPTEWATLLEQLERIASTTLCRSTRLQLEDIYERLEGISVW